MARISTYTVDNNINAGDKLLGSDILGLGTKNYTFQGIVDWFNATGGIAINQQNNYFFQTVAGDTGRLQGTVSFDSFGGAGTLFSAITQVKLAEKAVSGYTLEDYLPAIVGENIMFAQLDNLNNFGVYKVISITRDLVETTFFNVIVQFVEGHGALGLGRYYGISLTSLGVVQPIPTLQQVVDSGNTIQLSTTTPKGIDITLVDLATVYQNGVSVTIPAQTGIYPTFQPAPDAFIAYLNGQNPGNLTGSPVGYICDANGDDNIGFMSISHASAGGSGGFHSHSFDAHTGYHFIARKTIATVESSVFTVANNGDTTANSFIKIGGTASQYLMADGSVSKIEPFALTKTDDTNVTLTLGGTPATSLLQGVSLTLGWSGTLADSRITSAAIWNAKQDAITLTTTGTGAATFVANVLNIPTPGSLTGFVPYTGATTSVNLGTNDISARWGFLNELRLFDASYSTYGEISLQGESLFIKSSPTQVLANIDPGALGLLGYGPGGLLWEAKFTYNTLTADRTYALPNASGTIALTSNIPTITPSALTKTNDTNVTLTLGGTPNTALLQGVSLTLGWTGTLQDSRISSASNWNTAYTNRITSVTSTGAGGPSIVSNVLNIPNPASGTINYVSKFMGAISLGNSLIYDDGANVGIGTIAPSAKLEVLSTTFPVAKITRSTNLIEALRSTFAAKHITSGDMIDGFGPDISFIIQDNSGVENEIANFGAVRDGLDNNGALIFATRQSGSRYDRMKLYSDGRLALATDFAGVISSPQYKLYANGSQYLQNINQQLFLDDFNRTTVNPGGVPSITYILGSSAGSTAVISSNQLRIPNNASTAAGYTFVTGTIPTLYNGDVVYNTTLEKNIGLLTWSFNFRTGRSTILDGFGTNQFGLATILCTDEVDPTKAGKGYAVYYVNNQVSLVYFFNGLNNYYQIANLNPAGLAQGYYSARVTYDCGAGKWNLEARDDGASAFSDPATGIYALQSGFGLNIAFPSPIPMPYFGWLWNFGPTSTVQSAFFDNFNFSILTGGSLLVDGDIGIGTTLPDVSAKLDVTSTSQGFLPPRMTNAQRIAIATPAVGLMVYCLDAPEGLYVKKSGYWALITTT